MTTTVVRKTLLTAHVVFSVGWLGAVGAFLAMNVVGLTSGDAELARAMFRAMNVTGLYVIQLATATLPRDVGAPTLAPTSSIMGEILFIAVRSDRHTPMEMRDVADWTIRRRLLAMPGVAQVIPIGGEVRQYQVKVDPERLRAFDITLD